MAGGVLAAGVAAGLLLADGERLALTERGRMLHGEVVARLMAVLEGG